MMTPSPDNSDVQIDANSDEGAKVVSLSSSKRVWRPLSAPLPSAFAQHAGKWDRMRTTERDLKNAAQRAYIETIALR